MKQLLISVSITVFSVLLQYVVIAQVKKVGAIGITVGEMDRSVNFYTEVLGFNKISDEEIWGEEYEKLTNLFGLRIRMVRMRLGEETIELFDYLTSGGRSIPQDAKSNDL